MCVDELSKEEEELEMQKTLIMPRPVQPVLPTPELTPILLAYSYINYSTLLKQAISTNRTNLSKLIFNNSPKINHINKVNYGSYYLGRDS